MVVCGGPSLPIVIAIAIDGDGAKPQSMAALGPLTDMRFTCAATTTPNHGRGRATEHD